MFFVRHFTHPPAIAALVAALRSADAEDEELCPRERIVLAIAELAQDCRAALLKFREADCRAALLKFREAGCCEGK